MIGEVQLFPQYILISKDFRLTHNNLIGCNVLQFYPFTSLHTRQKTRIKMKNPPIVVGQSLLIVIDILLSFTKTKQSYRT
jgi:hypothetical protein